MAAWCALTVPIKFLKSWIQSHYADDLLECCAAEFSGAERVDLVVRQYGMPANGRPAAAAAGDATQHARMPPRRGVGGAARAVSPAPA